MSGEGSAPAADLSRLLGRDYWLLFSTPEASTGQADIDAHLASHVSWLLGLEHEGVVLASGPLLSGPGVGPGSGVTVLRAPDEDAARDVAATDPFVRAGLRTFRVYHWRLNEGSISVRLSLGTGAFDWS